MRSARFLLKAALFSICVMMFSFVGIASASKSTIPTAIHGHVLSYAQTNAAGYGGDIAYATPMKLAIMTVGVPNPSAVSCVGQRCYALSSGTFEYPVISSNRGRSWRNGGHWFAGAWADAAAFASRITTLSVSSAVAWFPGEATGFYSTSSAGRRWYSVAWPGTVARVTGSASVTTVLLVHTDSTSSITRVEYSSRDGGQVWTLQRQW